MSSAESGPFDSRPRQHGAGELARRRTERGGLFVCPDAGRSDMANHLTPDELSEELGIDRDEVIKVCLQESVPIYQGKIDKTLFQAQLEALGAMPQAHCPHGTYAQRPCDESRPKRRFSSSWSL